MPAGKLVVLTGPSGVGKGTLVKALLARHPDLSLSVSATTRSPRSGEVDGKDYYFVSVEQFQSFIERNELLEWAVYAGNYYGTPRFPVLKQIDDGKIVILEIEIVGAQVVKETFPDALRVFILPPSPEELERRLRGRAQDSEEAILKRLQRSTEEVALGPEFDVQVVNDDFETALAEIEAAIYSESSAQ